jgi:hypothetical protein
MSETKEISSQAKGRKLVGLWEAMLSSTFEVHGSGCQSADLTEVAGNDGREYSRDDVTKSMRAKQLTYDRCS